MTERSAHVPDGLAAALLSLNRSRKELAGAASGTVCNGSHPPRTLEDCPQWLLSPLSITVRNPDLALDRLALCWSVLNARGRPLPGASIAQRGEDALPALFAHGRAHGRP